MIDISQRIFSKISKYGVATSCVGLVVSIAIPPLIPPLLIICVISAISLAILNTINQLEDRTIKLKNYIYNLTTFKDLTKLDLGDMDFPDFLTTSVPNQDLPIKNHTFKDLPQEVLKCIQDYSKEYKKIIEPSRKELDESINRFLDERESPETSNEEVDNDDKEFEFFVEAERIRIDAKSLPARTDIHKEFFSKFVKQYAYNKYSEEQKTSSKKQHTQMSFQDYTKILESVIKEVKRLNVICSFEEVIRKPLEIQKEAAWMLENLKFAHLK